MRQVTNNHQLALTKNGFDMTKVKNLSTSTKANFSKSDASQCSLAVLAALLSFSHVEVAAEDVAPGQMMQPPSLQLTDRNFVNIASGEVSITLEDVGIGQGPLSLTHTIGTHSSDFVNYENTWGPNDKFHGGLKKKHFISRGTTGLADDVFVATYFDFEGSLDFEINGNGTFTPLNDPSYSLVHNNGVYTVTKPNGTVVEIPGTLSLLEGNTSYTQSAAYTKIIYPNGYTINVVRQGSAISSPIDSVYTNTGLQLKYVYNVGVRNLPPDSNNSYNDVAWPSANMESNGLNWSSLVPESVVAVNRGYEYCANSGTCSFQQTWPTATYHWPAGMPKAMYVQDAVFSVTDSAGRVTEYHHTPFDIDEGQPYPESPQNRFVTRISDVRLAGQTTESISYSYTNVFDPSPVAAWTFYRKNIGPATLSGAINKGVSTSYDVGARGQSTSQGGNLWQHKSGGHKSVEQYIIDTTFHVATEAKLWDRDVTWYHHGKTSTNAPFAPIINRVQKVENKLIGTEQEYFYDARGNVSMVVGVGVSQANYPTSCANIKTCNKPSWTQDNRGNRTNYTYHPESGNVKTITLPPNEQGIRAKTRYGYEQKYAWYKNSAGNLEQASTPVWLLTSEKTCRVGATRSDDLGCSISNAEIVKTFHYGKFDGSVANNLWLKGITVTADGESRLTCYSYDKYGNRISETLPKANLSTCP